METNQKSEAGKGNTKKIKNWQVYTFLILLGLGFVALIVDGLFFKPGREIFADIVNQTTNAYPELSAEFKPKLLGAYTDEAVRVEWADVTKQATVIVVTELTEGSAAGFRFQQEVAVHGPNSKAAQLGVRVSPLLMLYKQEGNETAYRLYVAKSNKIIEIDQHLAALKSYRPDFSSLKMLIPGAEDTLKSVMDTFDGLKGAAWPKVLPE